MAVTFWEGNDGSQDGWPLSTELGQNYDLKNSGSPVPNDEARSCTIVDAEAGTVINVYDSPSASRDDDWAQIKVNSKITSPVVVNTFEDSTTYGSGAVTVTYTKDNGLDGKVSYIEIIPPG
jgi:hypothetical protein